MLRERGEGAGILAVLKEVKKNFHHVDVFLKVVGNEKNGGSGKSQMLRYGAGPWMFIYNLNMQF